MSGAGKPVGQCQLLRARRDESLLLAAVHPEAKGKCELSVLGIGRSCCALHTPAGDLCLQLLRAAMPAEGKLMLVHRNGHRTGGGTLLSNAWRGCLEALPGTNHSRLRCKGKVKPEVPSQLQRGEGRFLSMEQSRCLLRVEHGGCQRDGECGRRIANIFPAIWHPVIIQGGGEGGKEGVCLGRGSRVLCASSVWVWGMFSITYKSIYTPGDAGKGEQKEREGTFLLQSQVPNNQVLGKKRCSIRKAGFLLIHRC